jgi:glycosyltransferase involved in cell wall biosynthesis
VNYFAEKGHEIHVISESSDYINEIKKPNIKIHLLKSYRVKALSIILNISAARRLIKEINPDILHALYAGVSGMLGSLSDFHPFLLTTFGSDILINSKAKLLKPSIKFMLNKADLITCNGQMLFDELLKLGIKTQKIRYIYWGTDTKKFSPGPRKKEIREELHVFDSPMIISLRNFEPVYDIETLIKAVPIVLQSSPDVKFVIAGDGSLKNKLVDMAKDLGVIGNIRFVGWLQYEKLPDYLRSADVYVSTSLSDGDLAQSTQQAMACNVPIVTNDLIVNTNRINDGENGFIFPTKDYRLLAEKIIILLKNNDLRVKMGEAGRRTIDENLNYYKNMEEAENLYNELNRNKDV